MARKKSKGRPLSYEAYQKERKVLKQKGYKLDRQQTRKEYKENYRNAQNLGMTNITKKLARGDISISDTSASNIAAVLNTPVKKLIAAGKTALATFIKDFKKVNNIKGKVSYRSIQKTNFKGYVNPDDPNMGPENNRQGYFFFMWDLLGSKSEAEAWFGY